MRQEGYVRALAGLLVDPVFNSELSKIVPEQWVDQVTKLRKDDWTLEASSRAAGLREDMQQVARQGKMLSIFCSLVAENSHSIEKVYWPSSVLRMEKDSIFPSKESGKGTSSTEQLQSFLLKASELRDIFLGAADDKTSIFVQNLMLLMQQYLWSFPCAYEALPDTSLYDHGRITSAITALPAHEEAILVGGDISGLQDFIYTISADGAASALRGRSFHLQLLNEILPRLFLHGLGLPYTNLIYAGGGNFYILAGSGSKSKIEEIHKRITQTLLAHHRGELYLALAFVPLRQEDFFMGRISGRWKQLGSELQRVKRQRFSELGNGLREFFNPEGHGGNETLQCRVCGLEHPGTHAREENKPRICPPCEKFEELGRDLRKAQYLVFSRVKDHLDSVMVTERGTWEEIFDDLGYKIVIGRESEAPTVAENSEVFALTDDTNTKLSPSIDKAVGRRFFVNVTPVVQERDKDELSNKEMNEDLKVGNIKPFDVMQEQASGVKRLGILRMDVDNLGMIFAKGLENSSLARIASLSFAVSLYFEGWVERLAESRNLKDGRDRLYSIYSGGDDLFFVGSWDAIVELAREIRSDLSQFVGNHPGIHASAGIVLVGGKYPLSQAAKDAGEAEDKAKSYVDEIGSRKNAITFLNQTVSWKQFGTSECENMTGETVHALMHQLVDMMREESTKPKPPRALLGILTNLQSKFSEAAYQRMREGREKNKAGEKQVLFGPWQWLGFYYLKRMVRRELGRNPEFAKKVELLNEKLKSKAFSNIEWIGLSARWAELLTRKID